MTQVEMRDLLARGLARLVDGTVEEPIAIAMVGPPLSEHEPPSTVVVRLLPSIDANPPHDAL